ncbi:MAG: GNAT family N-acetyltransferase [Bacteroidetes bacterium]|nr:MAG: GNAT family N-acetyltransferase [Bacteroidota bacterium]
MQIKRANIDNAKSIIDFQKKMAKETESIDLNPEILSKGVQAVFDDSSKGIYYVAIDNNKVIASLLTTYEWSDWRNGCVLWIQSVYVLPEYRGKGVFGKMYLHLKSMVENSNEYWGLRLYVDRTNVKAQKVYDKIGMDGEHYKMYEWFK